MKAFIGLLLIRINCLPQWGHTALGCKTLWRFTLAKSCKFSILLSSLIPLIWWTLSVGNKYLPRYCSITKRCSRTLPCDAFGWLGQETAMYPYIVWLRPPFQRWLFAPVRPLIAQEGNLLLDLKANLQASLLERVKPNRLRCQDINPESRFSNLPISMVERSLSI